MFMWSTSLLEQNVTILKVVAKLSLINVSISSFILTISSFYVYFISVGKDKVTDNLRGTPLCLLQDKELHTEKESISK